MPPLDFHALQIHPMTMRPSSRGRLGLRSSDPADSLRFHAEALGHPEDLDTLRRGVRLAREILNQSGLCELVAEEVWPGPGVSVAVGSNNLDDAIRAQARTIYHPSGTCRMGGDSEAVLDPRLRVRGIEGWGRGLLGHAGAGVREHRRTDDDDRRSLRRFHAG